MMKATEKVVKPRTKNECIEELFARQAEDFYREEQETYEEEVVGLYDQGTARRK